MPLGGGIIRRTEHVASPTTLCQLHHPVGFAWLQGWNAAQDGTVVGILSHLGWNYLRDTGIDPSLCALLRHPWTFIWIHMNA